MASKSTKKKAPKAAPRDAKTPGAPAKKAPPADGLTRAEIEKANASGPGAVAGLIRGSARKTTDATRPARGKTAKPPTATETPTKAATPTRERDPRLPKPGTVLTRTFGKKEIQVEVLDAGFRYDGKVWRSLSGIVKAVTGTSWNGFLAFGLMNRAAKPAPTEQK